MAAIGPAPAGGTAGGTAGGAVPPGPVAGGNVTVKGTKASKNVLGMAVPWDNVDKAHSAEIDPYAGTVNISKIRNPKKEAKLEAKAQAYLRGETEKLKGKSLRRIRNAIDDMQDAGYGYDPNAARPVAQPPVVREPTAGPLGSGTAGNHAMPTPGATAGTSADGTAGNFSRFFMSPDYQWRVDQQNKAVERSAAARGFSPASIPPCGICQAGMVASSRWPAKISPCGLISTTPTQGR